MFLPLTRSKVFVSSFQKEFPIFTLQVKRNLIPCSSNITHALQNLSQMSQTILVFQVRQGQKLE